MGNVSQHELDCKCDNPECSFTILAYEPVVDLVQKCCDELAKIFGVSRVILEITSAARCKDHNDHVGSNDNSRHVRADAMDIKVHIPVMGGKEQIPPKTVADTLIPLMSEGGVGVYSTFTHVDSRRIGKVVTWYG